MMSERARNDKKPTIPAIRETCFFCQKGVAPRQKAGKRVVYSSPLDSQEYERYRPPEGQEEKQL